jgi:hypothetical protein
MPYTIAVMKVRPTKEYPHSVLMRVFIYLGNLTSAPCRGRHSPVLRQGRRSSTREPDHHSVWEGYPRTTHPQRSQVDVVLLRISNVSDTIFEVVQSQTKPTRANLGTRIYGVRTHWYLTLTDGWKEERNLVLWLVSTQTCRSFGTGPELPGLDTSTTHRDPQAVVLRRRQKLHRMEIRVRFHFSGNSP